MSERNVEIPYLYNNIKNNSKILDVGVDRVGYTDYLLGMGCQVFGCDPCRTDCAYPIKFQDMTEDEKFDVVILLSTLEHFDISNKNVFDAQTEIDAINKARRILNPDGIIIITVPYGIGKVYGDFIQWDYNRLELVKNRANVKTIDECIFKCELINGYVEDWKLSDRVKTKDCEYFTERGHASAVYMAIWQ
jgi:SAM-dependent methyltransferase